ncbi:MAG TPA: helix-turn-helix transcriptional regulator [Acidimicrobiales bacterium]|nr:helix-turn-helix transcriptional regulator [Acidimicrobiales bacterium]
MDAGRQRSVSDVESGAVASRPAANRGPYARPHRLEEAGGPAQNLGRPSDALAQNLRAYRLLRHMTQDQLAARMAHLCHGWGRSTVSAVESRSRNVTVDELFGLAVSVGVTIGQLLDPTGPDHSRRLSLDVGLRAADDGHPHPVTPRLAHLWAASRAVIRLWHDQGRQVQVEVADDLPPATQRELEVLRAESQQT